MSCRFLISHQGGVSVGLAVRPCGGGGGGGGGGGEVDVLSGVGGGGGGRGMIHGLLAIVGGSRGEGRHGGFHAGVAAIMTIENLIRIFLSAKVFVSGIIFQVILLLDWMVFPWLLWKVAFYSARSFCCKMPEICGPTTTRRNGWHTLSYFPRVFYSATKNALLKCTRRLPNSSHIPRDIFSISKNAILVSFFPSPSLSVDCV